MKKILLLIILPFLVFAKDKDSLKNHLIIGINSHYGFIIPHSARLKDISVYNPWGLQTDIAWKVSNQNVYDYCNCYPKIGFSLAYFNFGKPDLLGSGISSSVFLDPVISYKRTLNPFFRFGFGLVYLTNTYDEIKNTNNFFFSTTISFLVSINTGVNIKISDNIYLSIAGYYNHISNGAVKNPNAGINFPTASIGIDYLPRQIKKQHFPQKELDELHPKRWKYQLSILTSAKKASQENQNNFIIGLTGSISRILAKMSAVNAGIEWISDNDIREKIRNDQTMNNHTNTNHQFGAAIVGHELLMGRFSFTQHLGIYLNRPYIINDPVYQRYGLKFSITRYLYGELNFKVHAFEADFVDIRIGASF
ncbi:acyloxyacyl hydrolase [bacterium AH-315-C07]|nr:acyloxyacyl hydrolase [bacterium AH-315-C07]